MTPLIITTAINASKNEQLMGGLRILHKTACMHAAPAKLVVITDARLDLPGDVDQLLVGLHHEQTGCQTSMIPSPVVFRFFVLRHYLETLNQTTPVLLVDARDVLFNAKFDWCQYDDGCVHLYQEDERFGLTTEKANSEWVRFMMGFKARLGDAIYCAGVIGGQAGALLEHVRDMCSVMENRRWFGFGSDQAAHCIVAHLSSDRPYTIHKNGVPALHCVLANEGDWDVNSDGVLISRMYPWNTQPSIVHQYDRWKLFSDAVFLKNA